MQNDTRKQFMRQLMGFLRTKMSSPDASGDVIVHRNEVGELAQSFGMDEEEAWLIFTRLKGRNIAWEGEYLPGSRSDERGFTAVRLTWVDPGYP